MHRVNSLEHGRPGACDPCHFEGKAVPSAIVLPKSLGCSAVATLAPAALPHRPLPLSGSEACCRSGQREISVCVSPTFVFFFHTRFLLLVFFIAAFLFVWGRAKKRKLKCTVYRESACSTLRAPASISRAWPCQREAGRLTDPTAPCGAREESMPPASRGCDNRRCSQKSIRLE